MSCQIRNKIHYSISYKMIIIFHALILEDKFISERK